MNSEPVAKYRCTNNITRSNIYDLQNAFTYTKQTSVSILNSNDRSNGLRGTRKIG